VAPGGGSWWATEYAEETHTGTLGPFGAELDAWDYKGQLLTDGRHAVLFEPSCRARAVPITMHTGHGGVELRKAPLPGVYFVKTGLRPEDTIAVRVVPAP
jgi:hypothetical protein